MLALPILGGGFLCGLAASPVFQLAMRGVGMGRPERIRLGVGRGVGWNLGRRLDNVEKRRRGHVEDDQYCARDGRRRVCHHRSSSPVGAVILGALEAHRRSQRMQSSNTPNRQRIRQARCSWSWCCCCFVGLCGSQRGMVGGARRGGSLQGSVLPSIWDPALWWAHDTNLPLRPTFLQSQNRLCDTYVILHTSNPWYHTSWRNAFHYFLFVYTSGCVHSIDGSEQTPTPPTPP